MTESQLVQPLHKIVRNEIFPLRIMGNAPHLCCPYEAAPNDKITLSHHSPEVVYMLAESIEQRAILPPFPRHFLLSKVGEYNMITASGYGFDGMIDVYSWKSEFCPKDIGSGGRNEREEINMVNLTRMVHIKGLENAIKTHYERIERPKEISLEEAEKVFDALRNHTPRY